MANRGKPKYIESPEKLWEYFEEYKLWAEKHPYLWHDFVGKDATEVWKKRKRPITMVGFEAYLNKQGILADLKDYHSNKDERYTEYAPIIRAIKNEIHQDIIEGATAGVYQQNIAARLTGLADKKEIEHTIPTPFINVDPLSDGSDQANNGTT